MRERVRLSRKAENTLHTLLLLVGMAGLSAVLGWAVAGQAGVLWTLFLGAFLYGSSARMPSSVVPRLTGARPLAAWQAPDLHALVAELARRANLTPTPHLYLMRSRTPNAFAVGRPDDAAIVVTDGLLHALPPRELAGVLAHEISHTRNDDIRVLTVAAIAQRLTRAMAFVGRLGIFLSLPLYLFTSAQLQLLPLLVLAFAPGVSGLLQLALSRTRELDADLDAAAITRDPRGLASALTRLQQSERGWLELLLPRRWRAGLAILRTHPHTGERVARLLELVPRYGHHAA